MRITSLIFVALWAFVTAQAQIVIVPREKLEAMNHPKVTAASLAMKFQTTNIKADPMGEDDGIKTFVYPFTNVGEDTLKIRRMVSGCSCMTAVCQKMSLAPGDSTAIVVKYNPKGHPGRFERKVMVEGLKAGQTKASVTSGNVTHEFVITVRANAGEIGWL